MNEPSLDNIMERLAEAEVKQGQLPPVNDWHPPRTYRIKIRIDREGRWYYQDSEIRRPAMVKLFATILRRDDDDHYYLVTPQERLRIQVDAYPLVATQVEQADGNLIFTINTGELIAAGKDHPISVTSHGEMPQPTIHVRDRLHALIHRNVFYELVEMAEESEEEDGAHLVISSQGGLFDLGRF